MKHLQELRGKVVTVFTVGLGRDFKFEKPNPQEYIQQVLHYFVGVLEAVDENGVLLVQALTGKKSFFYHHGIVAICEEEVLDPEDPIEASKIKDMVPMNKKKEPRKAPSGPVNPDDIQALLDKAKKV